LPVAIYVFIALDFLSSLILFFFLLKMQAHTQTTLVENPCTLCVHVCVCVFFFTKDHIPVYFFSSTRPRPTPKSKPVLTLVVGRLYNFSLSLSVHVLYFCFSLACSITLPCAHVYSLYNQKPIKKKFKKIAKYHTLFCLLTHTHTYTYTNIVVGDLEPALTSRAVGPNYFCDLTRTSVSRPPWSAVLCRYEILANINSEYILNLIANVHAFRADVCSND
jgi:hypothetical protein